MNIVGTTISGRYRIERLLGEGGMGAVYQAEHTLMHKRVAVKVLHAEMGSMTEVVARFEREAMAAANIEHPNVASATDFGKLEDGSFFLVLELVEGLSLREAIGRGRFEIRRAIHVTRQIASALSRAHGLGIVHRDLKPENVMLVSRDGDADFVKVLDFGIAKVPASSMAPSSSTSDKALTQLGMVYGTPEYMPPEQALGEEVDRRADFYALGVIFYEMLAGTRPFDDESKVKLLGKHISAVVPPLAAELQVPADLEALVMKLLAKDAADRVQEAKDIIEALDAMSTPPPAFVSHDARAASSSGVLPALTSGGRPAVSSGTHPTVLALGSHARTLAADVTRIVPVRIWLIAAATVFALVVALLVAAAIHGKSPIAVASASASSAPVDASFDQDLRAARSEVAAGQWDAAIAHTRALAIRDPAQPEPQRILFQALVGKGDTKTAFEAASDWVALDPNAKNDSLLRDAIKTAVSSQKDEAAAFALLESGKLGAAGADLLYDLAYTSPSPSPSTQTRARHALARPEVSRSASAPLQVTLDLRAAKDCEAKKQLLAIAAAQGDGRTLAVLDTYAARGGCGFLGTRDCYACMHKDGSLARTTEALRTRAP